MSHFFWSFLVSDGKINGNQFLCYLLGITQDRLTWHLSCPAHECFSENELLNLDIPSHPTISNMRADLSSKTSNQLGAETIHGATSAILEASAASLAHLHPLGPLVSGAFSRLEPLPNRLNPCIHSQVILLRLLLHEGQIPGLTQNYCIKARTVDSIYPWLVTGRDYEDWGSGHHCWGFACVHPTIVQLLG